jgi:tripartite-type tricarboxylate transporter receptor subunit TctC
MRKRRGGFVVAALMGALISVVGCRAVLAQPYPAKPVRIVVPFAPGGGTDLMARFLAQRLAASSAGSFFVDNKPGAGGLVGIEAAVKSAPDGYTLLMASSSYSVNPALYKLSFDPVADITAIIQISQGPQLLVANPALPADSVQELIALARQRPGAITFASAGQGSITQVAMELLCSLSGTKMTHVPYKGTGPALTDTVAGRADVFLSAPSALLPYVKSGRLRALAVTTRTRVPALAEIPTLEESGFPGFETVLWHGLIGPKGISRNIVERLNAEVTAILASKEAAEHLRTDAAAPAGGSPEQFLERIRTEVDLWRKVARDSGIQSQ